MSIVISVIMQLLLSAHALKTGRSISWVFIIALIPFLGCAAYVVVELVPEWLASRSGQVVQKKIRHTMDSDRALREAQHEVELADTVSNRMKLAEQYLQRQQFQEAKLLYEKSLVGFNKTDPLLMLGLATADFGLKNYAQTIATLDALKVANPEFKSQDGHLIYARAQEGVGNITAALHEYEALVQYYPSPEPTCRLALLLKTNGDLVRSHELFLKVVEYSKNAGRHYNAIHEEWISMAKRAMRGD